MLEELYTNIDDAIDGWEKAVPSMQKEFFDNVLRLVKELELQGNDIKVSVKNLRTLNKIKSKLDEALFTNNYLSQVTTYVKFFEKVEKIQTEYFRTEFDDFTKPELWKEIRKQTVEDVIDALTGQDISVTVVNPVRDLLQNDVINGSSFSDMVEGLKQVIQGSSDIDGKLTRYSNLIVNDAIMTYQAQYTKTVTDDLGLKWFQFVGGRIKTSRPICVQCIKKRWIHESEFPAIIKGNINGIKVPLCDTGLPCGMKQGTNPSNYVVWRNGWNCRHALIPTSDLNVPQATKDKLNQNQK